MTEGRQRVLVALRKLTADGWPANVREIAARAGLKSPSACHRQLIALERSGHAVRHPRNFAGGWKAEAP